MWGRNREYAEKECGSRVGWIQLEIGERIDLLNCLGVTLLLVFLFVFRTCYLVDNMLAFGINIVSLVSILCSFSGIHHRYQSAWSQKLEW